MSNTTIAAIATGMTDAGIGIVRISGPDSIMIADKIFKSKSGIKLIDAKSHTIHFGHVYDDFSFTEEIDEVLTSVFKAPKSYTGEDTVEINCHGGIFVVNKILEIVIKAGAKLASPGEFTKRAFLNGKLDLSKAEAVMDLISSKNEFSLKNSLKALNGNTYNKIKSVREALIYEIAFIESALDDPEHFDLNGYPDRLLSKIEDLKIDISKIIDLSKNGKIRKDGIQTVIVGKPNAGKSSFMNMLLGEERAIVTSKAGTTRDVLEESVRLDDIVLNIIDTAGIRNTNDEIEQIGIGKAKEYAKDADLILYMVDSSVPLDENDDDIIDILHGKNVIVLMNKSDLLIKVSKQDIADILGEDTIIISISAKLSEGTDEFKNAIKKLFFDGISINDEVIITNTRQVNELYETVNSLNLVINSINDGMPEDFFSIDLQNAYMHLGYIIGEEMNDDLVNEIFSKFCMGK